MGVGLNRAAGVSARIDGLVALHGQRIARAVGVNGVSIVGGGVRVHEGVGGDAVVGVGGGGSEYMPQLLTFQHIGIGCPHLLDIEGSPPQKLILPFSRWTS